MRDGLVFEILTILSEVGSIALTLMNIFFNADIPWDVVAGVIIAPFVPLAVLCFFAGAINFSERG